MRQCQPGDVLGGIHTVRDLLRPGTAGATHRVRCNPKLVHAGGSAIVGSATTATMTAADVALILQRCDPCKCALYQHSNADSDDLLQDPG